VGDIVLAEREIEAVDAEFKDCLQGDEERLESVVYINLIALITLIILIILITLCVIIIILYDNLDSPDNLICHTDLRVYWHLFSEDYSHHIHTYYNPDNPI